MEWVFYFLLFFFGYMTARTFYFVKASRLSITLIRISQIVALGMLAKSMEHFQYSKTYRLNAMALNGETEHNMQAFEYQINELNELSKPKTSLKEAQSSIFSTNSVPNPHTLQGLQILLFPFIQDCASK